MKREVGNNPNILLKLWQSAQYKTKLHFFHSTVAWWCSPGQIWNKSLCPWEYSGKYFYMLRVNGVIGFRFCSFGIAEVLWKFRELGKVVGKGGDEQGPAQWCSDALYHYPAVPLLPRESSKPSLPPSPSFPGSKKELWFLWRTESNRLCCLPSFQLWWRSEKFYL